ncbi:phage integrase SAM-like domain-containing protein [Chryseobacterium pennae]|nr:phage integrase SAM-like domain-containing protein [Chryseobacterium pennae]
MEAGTVKRVDGDFYSEHTIRNKRAHINNLSNFTADAFSVLSMEMINESLLRNFHQHLLDRNLAKNTISGNLNTVQFFIRRFQKEKILKFKGELSIFPTEITTAVTLSIEELQELYRMHLPPGQKKVLDIFICQCFLGLRVSDMFRFLKQIEARTRIIDSESFFEIVTGKKGSTVVIPACYIVLIIINRYGKSIQKGFSEAHYNLTIKKIVAKSRIERDVVFWRTEGGRRIERIHSLSFLISSHTARRTFATNGYLAGISPFDLMKITGHKSLASFFRYMRCENIAVALKLSRHGFFKIDFEDTENVITFNTLTQSSSIANNLAESNTHPQNLFKY